MSREMVLIPLRPHLPLAPFYEMSAEYCGGDEELHAYRLPAYCSEQVETSTCLWRREWGLRRLSRPSHCSCWSVRHFHFRVCCLHFLRQQLVHQHVHRERHILWRHGGADDTHFHLLGDERSRGDDQNDVDSSDEAAAADAVDGAEGRLCLAHRSAGTLPRRPSLCHGRHCRRLHSAPSLRLRPANWSSYHDCSSRHRDYARTWSRSMPPQLPHYRRESKEWREAGNRHMGKYEDDAMGPVGDCVSMSWIQVRSYFLIHCPNSRACRSMAFLRRYYYYWGVSSSSFLDRNAKP
mmetsp:Transcript_7475/g.20801  ORF Transcript_7475/g.20801 Transcript_7475/m.20801 type:complete len:293 (-) Transcript_7475:1019-1897(-)